MARSEIQGLRELEKMMQELGRVPQKVANKAARAGATIAREAAKTNAPVFKGKLKKGIVMRVERKGEVGKKVYDIMINPKKSDTFVKVSKTGKRSFYPASQEYGWTTNGKRTEGRHYLRRALEQNKSEIEKEVIETAGKEIDKILRG